MFHWIYDYPSGYIGGVVFFVFVATTSLGIYSLVRRCAPGSTPSVAPDMIAVTLATVSVLYGLLLGLLAVGTYQNFSSMSDIVTKEASSSGGALSRPRRVSPADPRQLAR